MNEDLQADLRELIRDLLGMPAGSVRPDNENQPTEGDGYALFEVTEMSPTGWAGSSIDAEQLGVATITIDFIGEGASVYSRNLAIAMQSFYAANALMILDMGLVKCGPARNLSMIEFERKARYQVKLMLSYKFRYERPQIVDDAYGTIENINISLIAEQ